MSVPRPTAPRKISDDRLPTVPGIGPCLHLPVGGPEVHAARIEGVHRHGVAQYVDGTVALRQTVTAGSAPVHLEFPLQQKCSESLLIGTT